MPKLILDVMGGDFAPQATLDGVRQALPELHGELVLIGDETRIRPLLRKRRYRAIAEAIEAGPSRAQCKVSLVHASENIEMEDSIRAVRSKPGATINVGCKMAAADWENRGALPDRLASAFISAGHSGAMMASALLNMGRLKGVERPAIAVKLPTLSPDGCVLLDVGANVDCKPEHLRDFAVMGALFAQVDRSQPGLPKVGLLSNGEERSKGNELTRSSLELIEALECFRSPKAGEPDLRAGNFVGYSEGKEIFKGQVDVVVTDGFVGNVVLKSVEGLGSAVVSILKKEFKRNLLNLLGLVMSAGVLRQLKKKLDYAETGAAPLLGVAGYAFICHGRSNAKAIKNALLRSQSAISSRFIENLEPALAAADSRPEKSENPMRPEHPVRKDP